MEHGLSLLPDGPLRAQQTGEALLALNGETAERGLTLRREEALMLAEAREECLQRTGRIEFGGGTLQRLIRAFCGSPYLTQESYAHALCELTQLFYEAKNETLERVSDQELVDFMQQAFDGPCAGSLELLAGQALPQLGAHLREGGSLAGLRLRMEEWV